ncbi:hypothetical protein MAQ5080_02035 [Marinomonas aquimarina]|uniref:Late embryogenesis abundant protein n=1 Tax=Marinomonas aquimarina TaxID=295068 RepID=A0A1A8TF73_9GAMM|nr:hypothetical protein [Marinomonas aquimarina]SBS31678.1 hypothetical protein MAQ5080_02035 [Marinomonas aquimarina]
MSIKKMLAVTALMFSSALVSVHAQETSAWQSIQQTASNAVEKTREVAANVADRTREVAVDVADRTREVAGDAADRSKEVGQDISNSQAWKKTKEVGNATAEAARSGAHKVKEYVNNNACDNNDKLNCKAE